MPKNTENFNRGAADTSAPSNDKNHKMANLMSFGKTATAMGDINVPGMTRQARRMTQPPKPENKGKGKGLTTGAGPDAKSARGSASKGERTRKRR